MAALQNYSLNKILHNTKILLNRLYQFSGTSLKVIKIQAVALPRVCNWN